MIEFDLNEKMKHQLFKDTHNGLLEEDYMHSVNPLQDKYDLYINTHKDDIRWYGTSKQFYPRFANYLFWIACGLVLLLLSIFSSFIWFMLSIPIGIVAGIALFNYDFHIGKCTCGCNRINSEIVGEEFKRGTGTKIIRCKKCGNLRYVNWYIGYD